MKRIRKANRWRANRYLVVAVPCVYSVGSAGGGPSDARPLRRTFRLGEFHEFYAGDARFAYLVPAGRSSSWTARLRYAETILAASELSLEELVANLRSGGLGLNDARMQSACLAN